MNAAGLAVGDLTHGIGVAGVPVPGLSFGTDMGGIFGLIGQSYKLVTVGRPRDELREPARNLTGRPRMRKGRPRGRPFPRASFPIASRRQGESLPAGGCGTFPTGARSSVVRAADS